MAMQRGPGTVDRVDHAALRIVPSPSDEEAAAIVAALDALWPRPAGAEPEAAARSVWKFSNRWWSQPLPLRRARPWV